MRPLPSLRSFATALLAAILFAIPARATWSILIVDLATGEVALGIATCLTGFDLRPTTVVVVPGIGVATAQSFVGPLSLRQIIRTELIAGTPPSQILALLAAADPGHQSRQYGIVDTRGGSATFTGTGAGAWAGGLTGQTGTIVYAVQGNVLTGMPVVQAAETAIRTTAGDLAAKLMAAMQAARSMGGDGRCSCASGPTACGSPPPSFTKSAHIGLMIVSRPGDADAPCNATRGCGAGQYWLDLNVANQPASAPDPVVQLQALYDAWRLQQVGRPDHFRSTVTASATSLRCNGIDTVTCTVTLRDAQGNALGNAIPLQVGLGQASTVPEVVFGPVVPQPNGTYTFTMAGALTTGTAVIDVAADDGLGLVHVSPAPVVEVGDPFGPCGTGAISDGAGGVIDALRIDGTGGEGRIVRIGFGQPFALTLDPPTGAPPLPPVGLFALWAHIGLPHPQAAFPLGGTSGALCFLPFPFDPAAPTLLVADSFAGGGVLPAPPAPWALAFPGLPALLDVTLQGAMIRDLQGSVAATNALLLRVQALPPPVITAVTPLHATAGANVTVTGSDFYVGARLAVAGSPTPVTSLTPTSIAFVMPAGVPCDSQLSVANPGGAPVSTAIKPTPVIQAAPFTSGSAAGGTLYVIVGLHLQGATVTFNGVPMVISSQTTTSIVGNTPPGMPGPAAVVVRSPAGCQAGTTFTYL